MIAPDLWKRAKQFLGYTWPSYASLPSVLQGALVGSAILAGFLVLVLKWHLQRGVRRRANDWDEEFVPLAGMGD